VLETWRKLFAEGTEIGSIDALTRGLDPRLHPEIRLAQGDSQAAEDGDAVASGCFGVPWIVADDEPYFGQDLGADRPIAMPCLCSCLAMATAAGRSSACDFRPSHLPSRLRMRSRASRSLATVVALSNCATAPSTWRTRVAIGVSSWAFDLMQLDGDDLRRVALEDRKRRLGYLIERAEIAAFCHSEPFDDGERLLAECDRRGLEGVVAKHKSGIYRSGRSTGWIKVKCPAWREANRGRGEPFGEGRFPT
jgi:hypothetical protein